MISNEMDFTTVPSENFSYNYSNRTANETVHEGNSMPKFLKEEQVTFLVFLLIAIIVGNLIVLVAVVISHRKTRMTFFILHLAIADLLVGVFSVLPDLVWRITEQWYAGDVMCRIVKFLQCLVTYGSTFVLVALSIDRFDAIARPLNFSRRRRCKILIAVAWGIAAIFSSPSLILFHFAQNQCVIQLGPLVYWQIYITLIAFVVFFIPAIIITFCYGAIIYVIWRHNKVLYSINQYKADRNLEKPLYPKDGLKQQNTISSTSRFGCGRQTSVSSHGIIPQAKIRTIKMTFAIVIVFIICWSPYFIWNLLDVYGFIIYNSDGIKMASIFIQSLAPLNSAANPIIYGIFSTRICRYLRRFRIIKTLTEIFPCCDSQDRDVSRRDKHSTYTATEVTDFSVSKSNTRCARSKNRQRYNGVQRSFDSSSERTLVEKPQSVEMCDLILSSNGAI